MSVLLGCIADDFTGATDLANTLVRHGMRTVQLFDVPGPDTPVPDTDAIVVALKSRTAPAAEAVEQSLASLAWLQAAGARQFFFKYCSTFDSTPDGNIGPVADALLEALGETQTIFCPAFPENGRTICHGYLFVGDVLLSESGMKDHPLTPMTDANLIRVLAAQTSHKVGLAPFAKVSSGSAALKWHLQVLREQGVRHVIVDALNDSDLEKIALAVDDMALITGGSGVALGLPENFRRAGLLAETTDADELPPVGGLAAVLSGSCSQATQAQVMEMRKTQPAFQIDPLALAAGRDLAAEAIAWAAPLLAEGPPLIYATAAPEAVRAAQAELGRERAGALVEACMATIAADLVERGVRRLVVAGGETSGAVVQALGINGIQIGPQIDPGVPWTLSLGQPRVALALKSGNFGGTDFFMKALRQIA